MHAPCGKETGLTLRRGNTNAKNMKRYSSTCIMKEIQIKIGCRSFPLHPINISTLGNRPSHTLWLMGTEIMLEGK